MSDLNDPRVLFAAERTLLAWSRTSLALMAFGFVIERFGLFLRILGGSSNPGHPLHKLSVLIGLVFIVFGGVLAVLSTIQHRRVLRTLRPVEIPEGYWLNLSVAMNLALMLLSVVLTGYLLSPALGL